MRAWRAGWVYTYAYIILSHGPVCASTSASACTMHGVHGVSERDHLRCNVRRDMLTSSPGTEQDVVKLTCARIHNLVLVRPLGNGNASNVPTSDFTALLRKPDVTCQNLQPVVRTSSNGGIFNSLYMRCVPSSLALTFTSHVCCCLICVTPQPTSSMPYPTTGWTLAIPVSSHPSLDE